MTRRRRPPLGPEDRALWRAAMRDTVPLPPRLRGAPRSPGEPAGAPPGPRPAEPPARPAAVDPPANPSPLPRPPRAAPGQRPLPVTYDLAPPPLPAPAGPTAPGLDRGVSRRLRTGRAEPQDRVDLHGMSAERAHRVLERFIAGAVARGLRLVLVITGKGGARTGPGAEAPFALPPPGLLRRQVPGWLRAGPHAGQIVGIFQAHPRHGGAGAIYVYLKKRREARGRHTPAS